MLIRVITVPQSPYEHLRRIAEDVEFEIINEEDDEDNQPIY